MAMYNPYQFQNPSQYQPMVNPVQYQQRSEVVRVNGRNGAEAFQMPPNSSVLLLDETAPIVWLKITDGASYPTLTGYEIKPIETETKMVNNASYEALEERIAKIEERLNEQSNVASVKQKRNGASAE